MEYEAAVKALEQHRAKKEWLRHAEEFLTAQTGAMDFSCESWRRHFWFNVNVPEEIWRPQLQSLVDARRAELADLDAKLREYLGPAAPQTVVHLEGASVSSSAVKDLIGALNGAASDRTVLS